MVLRWARESSDLVRVGSPISLIARFWIASSVARECLEAPLHRWDPYSRRGEFEPYTVWTKIQYFRKNNHHFGLFSTPFSLYINFYLLFVFLLTHITFKPSKLRHLRPPPFLLIYSSFSSGMQRSFEIHRGRNFMGLFLHSIAWKKNYLWPETFFGWTSRYIYNK